LIRRYVLTGAPGCGKTSILRALEERGYAVVAEAATDVIAAAQAEGIDEPWQSADFIGKIIDLQRRRQRNAAPGDVAVQVFDRSPICTLALAQFLGHPVSPCWAEEVERVTRERVYEPTVFFVRPVGFVAPTLARRISYEDSLIFAARHEATYRAYGFELVDVPPGAVAQRTALVHGRIVGLANAFRPGA